ncbi:MAG: hypothetical protein HFP81_00250 [Methylococcales symbiont of Hymedesmia sp. n. MRB-2018]|nr:MAG: hypothetical protein HFP81_00250 [Methylococcales symbiont of Hymedesmia sp. n. MRB-2018]
MRLSVFSHKLHRVSAYVIAIPFLVILITGILLLLRKDLPFMRSGGEPNIKVEQIQKMEYVFNVIDDRFNVRFDDIKAVHLYINRGIYRVDDKQGKTYNLKADDLTTISTYVKKDTISNFIFRLHEGTIFGDFTLYFIYLPSSIFMMLLLFSGIYFLTIRIKKKFATKRQQKHQYFNKK